MLHYKTLAITTIITVCALCAFGAVVVGEIENTNKTQYVSSMDFQNNFNSSIEKCYDEYDEVEGVNTVDIIDGLSTIHYAIEDNESKKDILNQFIPLFEKVNELGLDDKPLVELFNIILEGM